MDELSDFDTEWCDAREARRRLPDWIGFDVLPGAWFFYIGPLNIGWGWRVRRV